MNHYAGVETNLLPGERVLWEGAPPAAPVVSSRRTRYMITNSRVVVHGGWSGNRVTTAYLRSLPPPVITVEPDGSGSLAFGAFPSVTEFFTGGRQGWRAWAAEPSSTPVLRDVPDVRRIRDFVAQAQPKLL